MNPEEQQNNPVPEVPQAQPLPNPSVQPAEAASPQPVQPIPAVSLTPQAGIVPAQPMLGQSPVPQPVNPVGVPPQGPIAPPKKSRKKLFLIIGVAVGLLLIGAIVLTAIFGLSPHYSKTDLIQSTQDGTRFSYSEKWQKIDWEGTQVAYGDGSDLGHSHAGVGVITGSAPVDTPSFSSLADTDRKSFAGGIESGFKSNIKDDEDFKANCKGDVKVVSSDTFVHDDLIGAQILTECSKNEQGQPTRLMAVVGYGKDDQVHTLLVGGLKKVWDQNEDFFKAIVDSLSVE